jgi:hypothetical protein
VIYSFNNIQIRYQLKQVLAIHSTSLRLLRQSVKDKKPNGAPAAVMAVGTNK